MVPNVVVGGDEDGPGYDVVVGHFVEQATAEGDVAGGGVEVEEGVVDEEVAVVAEGEDVGVEALGVGDVAGVGEGVEEGREGEVVGEEAASAHVGVY